VPRNLGQAAAIPLGLLIGYAIWNLRRVLIVEIIKLSGIESLFSLLAAVQCGFGLRALGIVTVLWIWD
jgi:hypothetical protein